MPAMIIKIFGEIFSTKTKTNVCIVDINSCDALEIERQIKLFVGEVGIKTECISRIRITEYYTIFIINDTIIIHIPHFQITGNCVRHDGRTTLAYITVNFASILEDSDRLKADELSNRLSNDGSCIPVIRTSSTNRLVNRI